MPKQSDSFLYQNSSYYGQVKPENLLFNSNLQEFSQKASYICCLQTGGKLSPADSYKPDCLTQVPQSFIPQRSCIYITIESISGSKP